MLAPSFFLRITSKLLPLKVGVITFLLIYPFLTRLVFANQLIKFSAARKNGSARYAGSHMLLKRVKKQSKSQNPDGAVKKLIILPWMFNCGVKFEKKIPIQIAAL